MTVHIASQFTQRWTRWTGWKSVRSMKNGVHQHDDDGGLASSYTIWFYDGPDCHLCTIWKGSVPDGIQNDPNNPYTQSQNDSDLSDFVTNYLPTSNAVVEPKAPDGRLIVRQTSANKTKNFRLKVFSFRPGDPSSLKNKNTDFTDASDITMTCYKSDGTTTTSRTNAVKTIIDFEPTFNYEVIGGWIDVPDTISGSSSEDWWVSCIGVPDIPYAFGGSVPFVGGTNLEAAITKKLNSDGRATSYLAYDATYHTNKLRWILLHPTNLLSDHPRIQIYVEIFV